MSTIDPRVDTGGVGATGGILPVQCNSRPLHRVSEVRRQQGISLRSVARKLGSTVQEVRQEEDASNDMTISELRRWQQVLDVPLVDLLEDYDAPLSNPVRKRAELLRIMKTAKAIQETHHVTSVKRLVAMLVDQLTALMPELAEVSAWHSVGQRRTQEELGRTAERTISDSLFRDTPLY